MRLAKSRLVEPEDNLRYGTLAVAVSIFVFAYSTHFGKLPILVYYALWLPLVLVDHRRVLGNYGRYHWIFAFALFACLSVFWSRAPGVTARSSVQLLTHVVCALIAARTISTRTLSLGALFGIAVVLVYSFAFGRYDFDPFDGTWGFVGAFSSKNQLGFYSSLGLVFAFAIFAVFRERWPIRLLAIVVGTMSAYALAISHSATSVISTAATIATMAGIGLLLRFSPFHRRKVFLLVAIALPVLAALAVSGGAVDTLLGIFGKSTTLTGRTYLWHEGLQAAKALPVAGVGYQAYWVIGFSDAERLWAEFYITSRTGFHFHETYIETLVELGAIGAGLLALVIVGTVAGHLRRLLTDRQNPPAQLLCSLGMLLLIRSFVEVDVLNAYQVGSFLLYYAAGQAVSRRAVHVRHRRAQDGPPRERPTSHLTAVAVGPARHP